MKNATVTATVIRTVAMVLHATSAMAMYPFRGANLVETLTLKTTTFAMTTRMDWFITAPAPAQKLNLALVVLAIVIQTTSALALSYVFSALAVKVSMDVVPAQLAMFTDMITASMPHR